jgi:hypothetical protein
VTTFSIYAIGTTFEEKEPMLALFLNHPPIFVAGEIAFSTSLVFFIGALITAIARQSV